MVEQKDEEYFTDIEFESAEEAFEAAHDHLREVIASLQPRVSAIVDTSTLGRNSRKNGQANVPFTVKLLAIKLPKFAGSYTEWTNYKSLFETMIIQREDLNDVQYLNYL